MNTRTRVPSPSRTLIAPSLRSAARQQSAGPDSQYSRHQAGDHRDAQVEAPGPPGPFLEVLQGLVIEGGVGGEAAHQARGEGQAQGGREALHGERDLHDRTEEKRAEDVDGESAE